MIFGSFDMGDGVGFFGIVLNVMKIVSLFVNEFC